MLRPDSLLPPLGESAPSLTERAIEAVRAAIRDGSLAPGELYSVYRLADDLGVSRSPVRDALLRLAETGLIRFERNRGFRVVRPGPEELVEIFALRLALEVPAARRAALAPDSVRRDALRQVFAELGSAAGGGDEDVFMQLDQRLHDLILDLAGNRLARRTIENLRDATRLVGTSTAGTARALADIHAEHGPIVDAILSGNAPAAARAMDAHLRETGLLLVAEASRHAGGGSDQDAKALWNSLID